MVRGRGGLWWGIRGRMHKKSLSKINNEEPIKVRGKLNKKFKSNKKNDIKY